MNEGLQSLDTGVFFGFEASEQNTPVAAMLHLITPKPCTAVYISSNV